MGVITNKMNSIKLIFILFPYKMQPDSNPMEMIRNVCLGFWSFVFLFLFCELCQNMSTQFDIYGDELYYCDWYLLTSKLQRTLLIVLTNAQQPVTIHGYGNIECTRDTFKKVNETHFLLTSQVVGFGIARRLFPLFASIKI